MLWRDIEKAIKNGILNPDLEKLLSEIDNPRFPNNFHVIFEKDIDTFTAFQNASINQIELLLKRFPKHIKALINGLGPNSAFFGKFDVIDYLIDKGCDLNIIVVNLISGLREPEMRCLYIKKDIGYTKEKFENIYQTKLELLNKLIEQGINKNSIYEQIKSSLFKKIFYDEEKHKAKDAEIFLKSGACKAYIKALELLDPSRSLRDELTNKSFTEDFLNTQIKNYFSHYNSIAEQKIINRIIANPGMLIEEIFTLAGIEGLENTQSVNLSNDINMKDSNYTLVIESPVLSSRVFFSEVEDIRDFSNNTSQSIASLAYQTNANNNTLLTEESALHGNIVGNFDILKDQSY